MDVLNDRTKIILHVPPIFIGHEVLINHLSPAMNWECIIARGPYTKMQQQFFYFFLKANFINKKSGSYITQNEQEISNSGTTKQRRHL